MSPSAVHFDRLRCGLPYKILIQHALAFHKFCGCRDQADDFATAWTADSKAVLFMSFRNGKSEIFKQEVSRDTAEPLAIGPQSALLPRVSQPQVPGAPES